MIGYRQLRQEESKKNKIVFLAMFFCFSLFAAVVWQAYQIQEEYVLEDNIKGVFLRDNRQTKGTLDLYAVIDDDYEIVRIPDPYKKIDLVYALRLLADKLECEK
jgi:high-affinity Fe2+/Pb2+ permease